MKTIKPPTVEKFNKMSFAQQVQWIDFETGHRSQPNTVGYLIYEAQDVFIEFTRGKAGQIKEARAISLKEAVQGFIIQVLAKRAANATN